MEPADQLTTEQQTAELTKKVRQLIKSAGSSSHNQKKADAELVALGDEAIAILCSISKAEGDRSVRLPILSSSFSSLGWIVFLIAHLSGANVFYKGLAFGLVGIGATFSAPLLYFKLVENARATRLLASLDDLRVIGSLLDSLMASMGDTPLRDWIRLSLVRILPRLQSSDSAGLLPRHITVLNIELNHCFIPRLVSGAKVDYLLVVLKALEQVGDETSLPAVEKLIQTTDNEKVREAAEACLPFLQERAVLGKHTLLRAASHNSANLLVPAHGNERAETETDILLRAAIEPAGKP